MALHTKDRNFTIPVSGTSGIVELEDWDTFGLLVPTLDSSTLKIQGGQDKTNFFDIKDGTGTQVLNFPASTGAFAVASRDMADVVGYRYLRVVCGSAQNGGARTFTLTFKAPRRS
jgi:hypothetical protein